jgi:bifunctional DNA-binding transcriptional regulator/antitoxin component of YhaV-PrlF toxin-antitoxin module
MSFTSKLTGKNQTTIPKAVVQLLQLKPSSMLLYEIDSDGRVLLSAKSATFEELAGSFPRKRPKKPVTVEMMKEAIREGAVKRFRRSKP